MKCIWQQSAWPALKWDAAAIAPALSEAVFCHGRLLGRLSEIGFDYSLSSQIQKEKADYYEELEHAQRNSLDVTRSTHYRIADGCIAFMK